MTGERETPPSTLDAALALVAVLWAEVTELRRANAALTERITELEARLARNSTNSSRPPGGRMPRLAGVAAGPGGGETRASLPPNAPAGAFGPRLQALLSGRYRLSRREVAALCRDLLGVEVAVGSAARSPRLLPRPR